MSKERKDNAYSRGKQGMSELDFVQTVHWIVRAEWLLQRLSNNCCFSCQENTQQLRASHIRARAEVKMLPNNTAQCYRYSTTLWVHSFHSVAGFVYLENRKKRMTIIIRSSCGSILQQASFSWAGEKQTQVEKNSNPFTWCLLHSVYSKHSHKVSHWKARHPLTECVAGN